MSECKTPPAGQVIGGWEIVARIPGTRSWELRCATCAAERTASGVVVGRAIVDPTSAPTPCAACDELADRISRDSYVGPEAEIRLASRTFDLESIADEYEVEEPASPFITYNPDDLWPKAEPVVPTEQAMRTLILDKMAGASRSLQAAPGPSEIGGCERRLAHRMVFGAKDRREDASAWRPQVGTFGHSGLADWFSGCTDSGGRWVTDCRVTSPIAGTLDLYDREHGGVVIDFKFVGITTLKAARKGQISEKYRTQLALYGLGMVQAGHDVATLALWFLPSAGSLDDAHYEEWPFDERVAWAAVAKRDRIAAGISLRRSLGEDPASILPLMSTSEDYCRSCPALGAHCAGAEDVKPGSLGLELVR